MITIKIVKLLSDLQERDVQNDFKYNIEKLLNSKIASQRRQ